MPLNLVEAVEQTLSQSCFLFSSVAAIGGQQRPAGIDQPLDESLISTRGHPRRLAYAKPIEKLFSLPEATNVRFPAHDTKDAPGVRTQSIERRGALDVQRSLGANRIDHRSLLADEEMARAMEHQAALLLERLGLDEPHVCPGDRLADGLGVSGIVLLSLEVRLHVRPVASSAPCDQGLGARATNNEMRRTPRCRPGRSLDEPVQCRLCDRTGARARLNRCCALTHDLGSMLRDKMLKILLQHNLPTAVMGA